VNPPEQSDHITKNLIEKSYSLSIEGSNDKIISRYLNDLVSDINTTTINNIIATKKQKINNRLEEISIQRELLIAQAKKARLNQIQIIIEEDSQQLRDTQDSIIREKNTLKEKKLNQIQVLLSAAKLADSLGIINNEHGRIIENNKPEWHLFGKKALLEKVEALKSQMNVDYFSPELVLLNNKINEIQNNNLLLKLEKREDDIPFITGLNAEGKEANLIHSLDLEKSKLEKAATLELRDISSMQLTQYAKAQKMQSKNNRFILPTALIGGFMLSIFLALLMSIFKENETEPTTETSS
jgi:hypothetical protein